MFLADPRDRTDDLSEGPVCDSLAVGETRAAHRSSVEAGEELSSETRLPDAGLADDSNEVAEFLLDGKVELPLGHRQLCLSADQMARFPPREWTA